MNYLSEEEQFKELLNDEEIRRIKNPEIRAIREKYWALRHEAFLNERGIADWELGNVSKKLRQQEHAELEQFKGGK